MVEEVLPQQLHPGSYRCQLVVTATNWHRYLDRKPSVRAVFFDLSKPLTVFPSQAFLHQVGVLALCSYAWYADYLSDHSQRVVLHGHPSQISKDSSMFYKIQS